jgi:MFS family permease
MQSVYLTVSRNTARTDRGTTTGAVSSLLMAGQIAGPLIGGTLAYWYTPQTIMLYCGLFVLTGAVIVFVFFAALQVRSRREVSNEGQHCRADSPR